MTNIFGKIIGLVVGLIFTGFGCFFLYMTTIPLLFSWVAAQKWQPVQAELMMVEGNNDRTSASYRYVYRGKEYHNDHVYLADFKDNIGSYHGNLQQRLQHHLRTKQPIQIWVDPLQPHNAVIDKEMRWGLFSFVTLFCAIFISIGLTLGWASLFVKHSAPANSLSFGKIYTAWREHRQSGTTRESFLEHVAKLKNSNPAQQKIDSITQQDWLKKKAWQPDGIRSDAQRNTIGMWVFAMLWNGISSPVLFFFAEEWRSENYAILIALLFPLIGLYLLYKAITTTLEYLRFGQILCKLDPFPGALGGNVGGTFEMKNITYTKTDFRVELECVFSYVSGSGKNRSRREKVLWAEAGNAKVESMAKGIRLLFGFDIPADLPQSDVKQQRDYYLWRLKLHAKLPGTDLNRSYTIPVYATGKHSSRDLPDLSRQMQKTKELQVDNSRMALERGDFDGAGLKGAVKIRKVERGILLVHSMFRNKLLTMFSLFFGISFSAATYMILTSFGKSGFFAIVSMIFSIPFALVGLVGIGAAIYLPLNNLRVTIAKGKITVLRRLLFIPVLLKTLTTNEISEFTLKKTGSSGQGIKRREYYKIIAHTKDGVTVTISEGICGHDVAEQFKAYLYRRMQAGY